MKYLLRCCHEEKTLASMSESECVAVMEETMAYCEALKQSGHLNAVEQLEPVQRAMTVRVRSGKLSVTDGPFAETKEQIEVSIRAVRQPGSAAGQGDVRSVSGMPDDFGVDCDGSRYQTEVNKSYDETPSQ